MDLQGRSLRLGALIISAALLLRLTGSGFFTPVVRALEQPGVLSFLVYLETGRIIRLGNTADALPRPTDDTEPTLSQTPAVPPVTGEAVSFSEKDAAGIVIKNHTTLRPAPEELITAPLRWDLTADAPTVLIYHTHATESYTRQPGETYEESADYRTLDMGYNMVSVGERLAMELEQAGIRVIRDTTLHDYPSYNGSYTASRLTVEDYLKMYPSISLVLDLHRDAADDGFGGQIAPAVMTELGSTAGIMPVVGTNAAGSTHPNWRGNLSLALQLCAALEREAPGITRGIDLRTGRFNQDLSAGAMLIEVGAAGNTRQEALNGAMILARAIIALAHGANHA